MTATVGEEYLVPCMFFVLFFLPYFFIFLFFREFFFSPLLKASLLIGTLKSYGTKFVSLLLRKNLTATVGEEYFVPCFLFAPFNVFV